jgi:hypothetical protein
MAIETAGNKALFEVTVRKAIRAQFPVGRSDPLARDTVRMFRS